MTSVLKPVYVLGMETIRAVAKYGQLETEHVNFVAADDLFHKDVLVGEIKLFHSYVATEPYKP